VRPPSVNVTTPKSGIAACTMTIGGDGDANVITVEDTAYKLFLNGLDGNDTFNFKGAALGRTRSSRPLRVRLPVNSALSAEPCWFMLA
jgi:hypothetical protein